MNVFITTGTYDYLKKIYEEHKEENVILMQNEDSALLYHETEGQTFFNQPRSYEIVDGKGDIQNGQFIVMNNIPVTEEGRPIFEYRFKNRSALIDNMQGFKGIRILRPKSSDTYIVLTSWENEESFENWQNSLSFEKAHANASQDSTKGPNIFARPSYVTKFFISKETE